MARNAEKAMTTLARWRAAQLAEQGKGNQERRPYLASECGDLASADKWRMQIVREIAKKVAQIQNAGLGEFRIRDLNDEINKLLREKRHWEIRIKELGGRDYARYGPRMLDHEGREVPGNRGYKYFGAAKDLPGVRELFEHEPPPAMRKSRAELMKDIDADYYGYRDDDDGLLIPLEKEEEKRAINVAIEKYKKKKESDLNSAPSSELASNKPAVEESIYTTIESDDSDDESPCPSSREEEGVLPQQQFIAHVPVPSQKDIEEALLERKKRELLNKYVSESLQAESEQLKELLPL